MWPSVAMFWLQHSRSDLEPDRALGGTPIYRSNYTGVTLSG